MSCCGKSVSCAAGEEYVGTDAAGYEMSNDDALGMVRRRRRTHAPQQGETGSAFSLSPVPAASANMLLLLPSAPPRPCSSRRCVWD